MGYKCREVKCPCCGHIFMWMNALIQTDYMFRLKLTGELLAEARCPKCGKDIVMKDHVLEGIDIDDERIEKQGVRGI